MKTLLLAVLCFVSFSTWADTSGVPSEFNCQQLESSGLDKDQLAQRGCCSHHSGVCGCSGGRVTCCDGSFSPSCVCHATDPKGEHFLPPEESLPKT